MRLQVREISAAEKRSRRRAGEARRRRGRARGARAREERSAASIKHTRRERERRCFFAHAHRERRGLVAVGEHAHQSENAPPPCKSVAAAQHVCQKRVECGMQKKAAGNAFIERNTKAGGHAVVLETMHATGKTLSRTTQTTRNQRPTIQRHTKPNVLQNPNVIQRPTSRCAGERPELRRQMGANSDFTRHQPYSSSYSSHAHLALRPTMTAEPSASNVARMTSL